MRKSLKLIFSILYFLFLIGLIYILVTYLRPVIISIIISYILYPLVKYLNKRGINTKIASLISVIAFIIIISLILIYVFPIIVKETIDLMNNMNVLTNEIQGLLNFLKNNNMPPYIKNVINHTIQRFEVITTLTIRKIFDNMFKLASNLPTYILIPIFVYYFLSDVEYFKKNLKALIPYKIRDKVLELFRDYDKIIGAYLKGQLILSIIIAFLTLVVLLILKIKYAFVISLVNGVTNIIPYFGPILGFIPAFLSALTESTTKAISVSIAFFAIQQFEGGIIAPKILENAMGIHPVFVIIALILGGKFFGAWGLILSVPIFAILKVTYNYIVNKLY